MLGNENMRKIIKLTQTVTLIDNQTNEEYTGNVIDTTFDIVTLGNVKGFKGTAVFMMNQFKLKA